MSINNSIAKNLDVCILGMPLMGCAVLGTGMNLMEQSSNFTLNQIGWLGSRLAIVGSAICGVPLIIYSLAKSLLAATLNTLTFNTSNRLNHFQKFSEKQFFVIVSGVGVSPLVIMHAGPVVTLCIKTYQKYKEINQVITQIQTSPEYKDIENIYRSIKRFLNSSFETSKSLKFSDPASKIEIPKNPPIEIPKNPLLFILKINKYEKEIPVLTNSTVDVIKLSEAAHEYCNKLAEHKEEIYAYLINVIKTAEFQLSPTVYIQNWKKERRHTEEYRCIEDPAMLFFDTRL